VRNAVHPGKSGLPPVPLEKRPYGNFVFQHRAGFGQAFSAYLQGFPLGSEQNAGFDGLTRNNSGRISAVIPKSIFLEPSREPTFARTSGASSFPQG
jgi:hypothetical protein